MDLDPVETAVAPGGRVLVPTSGRGLKTGTVAIMEMVGVMVDFMLMLDLEVDLPILMRVGDLKNTEGPMLSAIGDLQEQGRHLPVHGIMQQVNNRYLQNLMALWGGKVESEI